MVYELTLYCLLINAEGLHLRSTRDVECYVVVVAIYLIKEFLTLSLVVYPLYKACLACPHLEYAILVVVRRNIEVEEAEVVLCGVGLKVGLHYRVVICLAQYLHVALLAGKEVVAHLCPRVVVYLAYAHHIIKDGRLRILVEEEAVYINELYLHIATILCRPNAIAYLCYAEARRGEALECRHLEGVVLIELEAILQGVGKHLAIGVIILATADYHRLCGATQRLTMNVAVYLLNEVVLYCRLSLARDILTLGDHATWVVGVFDGVIPLLTILVALVALMLLAQRAHRLPVVTTLDK